MFITLFALRAHILPLAAFPLHLEEPPPVWNQEELRLVSVLFPGARGWTSPALLANLRSFSFPVEMPSLGATSIGAKRRVHRWGDAECGGLHVHRRLQRFSC